MTRIKRRSPSKGTGLHCELYRAIAISEIRNWTITATHLESLPVTTGSSSVMYWVFPITPHIGAPVAACHFFDMLSPVWQPQLLIKAPRANARPLICFNSSSCSHDFAGALDVAAVIEHEALRVRMAEVFEVGDLQAVARLAVIQVIDDFVALREINELQVELVAHGTDEANKSCFSCWARSL